MRSGMTSESATATIFLIGKTGVGKSNFIKLLGGKTTDGERPLVGEGIDSCTEECTLYYTTINNSNKEVILVDTPGFDDSGVENLDTLVKIISILYRFGHASKHIQIHGVVFLHDISETKFSGSQKKTLSILRALCGEECMGNVIIGTTKWSPEKPSKFGREVKRERDLVNEHWHGIYKTTRLVEEDDKDVAVQTITDLLAKAPVLLLVQKELLTPPHTIENTTVGKLVIPEAGSEKVRFHEKIEQRFLERKRILEAEKAQNDTEIEDLERALAEHKKRFAENSEKNRELEQLREVLRELADLEPKFENDKAKMGEGNKKFEWVGGGGDQEEWRWTWWREEKQDYYDYYDPSLLKIIRLVTIFIFGLLYDDSFRLY